MSRYYGAGSYAAWAPYVPVAERRRQAEQTMSRLRKSGQKLEPVTLAGRVIARTFWGRAWCSNLESYRDYESRLPRGRSYVRNGLVVDLHIAPGRITAMVSGSELYRVSITIKEAARTHWRAICNECAGGIDSLVQLLQGRFSKHVMDRLCRQENGLFPRPSDIRFTCSCPDHASMCKHVAATLYGVGARLDDKPDLLFRLRAVDAADLIAGIDTALPLSKAKPGSARVLETADVSALFGLDMASAAPPAEDAAKPVAPPAKRAAKQKTVSKPAASRRPAAKKVAQRKQSAAAKATSGRPKSPSASKTAAAQKAAKPAASATAAKHGRATAKRVKSTARPGTTGAAKPREKPVKWW